MAMSVVGAFFNRGDPSERQGRSDVIATLGKGEVSAAKPGTERWRVEAPWCGRDVSQGGAEMDFYRAVALRSHHLSSLTFIVKKI
jgi:hypothetical protein